MKQKKGISLIVLVIIIIVMIIISGAIILILTETSVIDQAEDATYAYNNKQYFELITNEYLMLRVSDEVKGKTSIEVFEMLKDKISKNAENVEYMTGTKAMNITIDNTYKYTALYDGEVKYGKYAYLDIADGSIQLKSTGYIQGTNPLVESDGDYIITGTTTENNVQVMEEGTYNITIRDLNIDVSSIDKCCAFNANKNGKSTNVYVNLYIEGNNLLRSGSKAAGLGFPNANPNIMEVTNASMLTIQGNGKLYVEGGSHSAGIGTGYLGDVEDANNIIINSGNIIAESGGSFAAAIGSGRNNNTNNIIINGGTIKTISPSSTGIGACKNIANNIIINGGIITAEGGEYGHAIGGAEGSSNITINGGKIYASTKFSYSYGQYYALGMCDNITINGGTLICYSKKDSGIYSDATPVVITGGNVYSTGGIAPIGNSETAKTPISGENNVYLTEIQLQNVTEEVEVTSFITSDNIDYGIKDMYTTSEGKIYVYLPTGERTITIKAGEKEYTGTVTTGESDATEVVILNEK